MYQMLIDELRRARRTADLTQATLGELIGVDAQRIRRLEAGVGSVPTLIDAMSAVRLRLTGIGPGATLSEQLRNRRVRRAMSISAVADRTGLSRTTIAEVECGRGSVDSLLRLMAVVAPAAKRSAPERSYWGAADKVQRDSRFTPPEFLADLTIAFGDIDLDPCAHERSPVVASRRMMLSEGGDGLVDEWSGGFAFMNPPFSELLIWLKRAHQQWRAGNVTTVACLVPVRTDSAWFHETLAPDADIYLLRGRVRFLDADGKAQPTPFSLMVVALGASTEQRNRYARRVPGYWLSRPALEAQVQTESLHVREANIDMEQGQISSSTSLPFRS